MSDTGPVSKRGKDADAPPSAEAEPTDTVSPETVDDADLELAEETDAEAVDYAVEEDTVAAPPDVDAPVELVEPAPPVSGRSEQPVVLLDSDDDVVDGEYPEAYAASAPVAAAAVAAPLVVEQPRVVYVEPPVPPRKRHNRLFGALIALASTVIFAALYVGVVALLLLIVPSGAAVGTVIERFVVSWGFWIPVIAYAVFAILLTLIVNRAGWWVHVLGSLFVGVLVYLAAATVLVLLGNPIAMTPDEANAFIRSTLARPELIIAGFAAREVSLWIGLGIAARGRRVTARNIEAREAFDREQSESRVDDERAYTGL